MDPLNARGAGCQPAFLNPRQVANLPHAAHRMTTSQALSARVVTPAARAAELPPCLYCAGRMYEALYEGVEDRLKVVPGVWSFRSCCGCGSAMLSPHPRAEELASFYPPVYGFVPEVELGGWRRLLARAEYRWFFRPQYAAQVRRVLRGIGWRGRAGLRLLDVGCGRGLRLLAFRERGFEVHGMDFQPEVVDYVSREHQIPAVAGTAADVGAHFPPASFDLVTSFFVLEHLPDVGAVLGSCLDLLKPGGWFVGAVPLIDGLQVRLFGRRWVGITEAPRHLSLPSRRGLVEACERAGFTSAFVRPDAVTACASHVGLSLFPGAATSHVYGDGGSGRVLRRVAAGTAALAAVPWCLLENCVLGRPAQGLVFARKPEVRSPGH